MTFTEQLDGYFNDRQLVDLPLDKSQIVELRAYLAAIVDKFKEYGAYDVTMVRTQA